MASFLGLPVEEMTAHGAIDSTDVFKLRSLLETEGAISAEDADALFAIEATDRAEDRSWVDFFVATIADLIVTQTAPVGYLDEGKARWLTDRIALEGRLESRPRLELLITVIARARYAPPYLSALALDQVRLALADGCGPLGAACHEADSVGNIGRGIDTFDVELIRRILYAFGGDEALPITAAEAEVLLAIDEVASAKASDARSEWADLFAKITANLILAASGHLVPTRERALARDLPAVGGVDVSRTPLELLNAIRVLAAYRGLSVEARAIHDLEMERIELVVGASLAPPDADWLAARLTSNARTGMSEQAIMACVAAAEQQLHPALRDAVDRIARAA
ncbi:MAG: hypothetical protein AB7E80_13500 [Hyphomicrobiaceae bacterium]